MIDLLTPHPKVERARKPAPERDWDNMPGTWLGPDHIRAMTRDTLRRDVYKEPARLKAWEIINGWHQWARKNNPGLPPDTGIYFFSADMGKGKSHAMISIAALAWMFRAVPVFSTKSVGACFGYQLELDQMYAFADVLPPGSIMLLDEAAALVDQQTARANRGRTLNAGMTSFRKGGNLMFTATAFEAQVAWQLKVNCKALIEPRRAYPYRIEVLKYDHRGEPKEVRKVPLREGEMEFPPFCHVEARGVELPWVGKRFFQDLDRENREARFKRRRVAHGSHHKIVPVRMPSPYYMDLSARVYDTFERVPIDDAHAYDSEAMARSRELRKAGKGGAGNIEEMVNWARGRRVFQGYAESTRIPIEECLTAARAYDGKIFDRYTKTRLRRELMELYGPDACSTRTVSYDVFSGYLQPVKAKEEVTA